MTFDEVLEQALEMLRRRGRVSYRALKVQFHLDDDLLEVLKEEIVAVHQLGRDQEGTMLVWTGDTAPAAVPVSPPTPDPVRAPLTYTPPYLAEKIFTSRAALEGERKQVTVLFADLKGSTELIADLDPEEARQLLDPALHVMMDAVHRYEGTVNQVLGDGIMALFGAPVAHEDHAVRACYAALAMQAAMRRYAEEVRRAQGLDVQARVGLNSGEVVVRSIGNDLHMDYSAVGQTTHLAARMEQLATPGTTRLTAATLRLVEGLVQVNALGPFPVKGLAEPVEVFELVGASAIRRRLQASAARGLTRFVGRQQELAALQQALERAGAGHGQVVALVGEAGVGKSRLVYEFIHSHQTPGWLVLESASVSYGKATSYFPVIDLLKRYSHVEDRDDTRTVRAKVTGQVLTLDPALQDTVPALLALLDALPEDSPFLTLDPPQRRQRTLDALKRVLLRESQEQPLLLVFEDLHWIDAETQALLNSLVESLPTARLLLLVNYRPEYQHGWGSKTYYTQLRLDPLPPVSAEEFLQALLGDDPSLKPLTRPAHCAHGGQSLLPGRERAHPGRDGGPRRRARGLSPGAGPGGPPGPRHRAGRAGGPHRPVASRGEAPAADGGGDWHGGALAAAARDCRRARGGAPASPDRLAERRVPLRDAPLSRARVHLQARPDPRGGLRQPPAGAAAGAACPHRRGPGGARRGAGGRAGRTAGPPCPAGGGVGQGPGVLPAGGEKAMARSAYREAVGYFEQALSALPHLPDSATRASRPSISGSPCARRFCRLATWGVSWRTCARPSPSLQPSTTLVGWDRSLSFCHAISTSWVRMTRPSPPPSAPLRSPRPAGMPSCTRWRTGNSAKSTRPGRLWSGDRLLQADHGDPRRGAAPRAFWEIVLPAVNSRAWLAECHAELGTFAEGWALGDEGLRIAEAVAHPASLA